MDTLTFIIGMGILGICIIIAAFVLSGAITGAAASLKESSPKALQQPVLNFLTEFDTADYLGLSITELDYVRAEGMLDGTFVAVTSLEQTGTEEYTVFEDNVEKTKSRPVMAQVTRFLFDRELLDQKMLELIREGKHINPYRQKAAASKKAAQKGENGKKAEKSAKAEKSGKTDNDKKTTIEESPVKELAPELSDGYIAIEDDEDDEPATPIPGFNTADDDEDED